MQDDLLYVCTTVMPSAPVPPLPDRSLPFHELVNFHMQNDATLPMFVSIYRRPGNHTIEITFLELPTGFLLPERGVDRISLKGPVINQPIVSSRNVVDERYAARPVTSDWSPISQIRGLRL